VSNIVFTATTTTTKSTTTTTTVVVVVVDGGLVGWHSCPIGYAVITAPPSLVHPLVPSTADAYVHAYCLSYGTFPGTNVPMNVGLPHISDMTGQQ